jgi:transcriptional regulator with XRE-family HTH domain
LITKRPGGMSTAGRQIAGGPRQALAAMPGTSTRNWRFLTVSEIYGVDKIGPLLARLREERGYSQGVLAQRLCDASRQPTLTRHEVSRWERHERIPSEYWLHWLGQVLGVPVGTLRLAVAETKGRRTVHVDAFSGHVTLRGDSANDPVPVYPAVYGWLTFHQGPKETVIALSGVEVDQIRTVLSPVSDLEPTNATSTAMEAPQ